MTDFWGVDLRKYMLSSSLPPGGGSLEMKKPPVKAASRTGPKPRPCRLRLRGLDVVDGNLAGAAVLGGVEGHLLAFDEAADAGALECRRMDENVLAAIVGLDEAEAFLIVVE